MTFPFLTTVAASADDRLCALAVQALPDVKRRVEGSVKDAVNFVQGKPISGEGERLDMFRATFELGGDGNEIDIRATKDGVLVCLHDTTLDRTTDVREKFPNRGKEASGRKTWPVAEFTLDEIKTLDAGKWKVCVSESRSLLLVFG